MTVPLWVEQLADLFWAEAEEVEPFPRNLRRSIARALPIAVVFLPHLRLEEVRSWLDRNGIPCPCAERDRPLRACLVARSGWAFIFIDGSDTEAEQRFSLAHELAHFLRHYWQPRRKAVRRLGEEVIEVFDGVRPPTRQEQLGALLANVPLGFHMHLMGRDGISAVSLGSVAIAEWEADLLAFELLAPAAAILASLPPASEDARVGVVRRLEEVFGLPPTQAQQYGDLLMPAPPVDPLLARLGLGS